MVALISPLVPRSGGAGRKKRLRCRLACNWLLRTEARKLHVFLSCANTFGSRLRAANVHFEDIAYLLGNGTRSITPRYAHPNLHVLRTAVATLDQKHTQTDTGTILQFKSVSA
jgi:hypothetical protein